METIKGYKAFNKDMTCKGFKFEEGQTYKCEKAKCCEEGFHMVINPLDALSYYDITDCVFHEVESLGKVDKNKDDSKIATTEIKIGARLNLKAYIKASIDFCLSICKSKKVIASGNYSKQAASGDYSTQAASGYYSKQELNGKDSVSVSAGHGGQAKGKIGCWICLSEWKQRDNGTWYPFCVKSGQIDGKELKEDIWYELEDGELKEKSHE